MPMAGCWRAVVVTVMIGGAVLVAPPAMAQSYGGGGGGPSFDDNRTGATVSPVKLEAGGQGTFQAPAGTCSGPANIFLVRATVGAQAVSLATSVAPGAGGGLSLTFSIPPNSPGGVYYVYAVCIGSDGETNVAIAPLVVLGGGGGGGQQSLSASGRRAASTPPPAVVAVQVSSATEAAIAAAAARGATIVLGRDGLVVRGGLTATNQAATSRGSALPGGDIAARAGLVALLVAAGLVSLRRRSREARH